MKSQSPGWLYGVLGAIIFLVLAQFIDGRVAFAIGCVVAVAIHALRTRRKRPTKDDLGMTQDEFAQFEQNLQSGNHEEATGVIATAQARMRKELEEATGIDVARMIPEIGQELPWGDIVNHIFRVLEFDRSDTTIDKDLSVKAKSVAKPYGYLLVESPILNNKARLPICHRDDFGLAASVFDEPVLADLVTEQELLVTYSPRHLLPNGMSASPRHMLHYVITPRGTLDEYYSMNNDAHYGNPDPHKLFGPFVYEGEISVRLNREPKL